jgi:hypothetical protein
LEEFCHPLNFDAFENRDAFVKKLNEVLSYVDLRIKASSKDALVETMDGVPLFLAEQPLPEKETRTSTDYIVEAVRFFREEYNKVRMSGLSYDYPLGENPKSQQTNQDYDVYDGRLNAIKRLKDAGFVTQYQIEERIENEGYYLWDYAVCKIDERQLTDPQENPRATSAGVEAITQRVVHEHTLRFENSIQEKGIDLNHKFPEQKVSGFYITKKDDDFYYKGRYIDISKTSDYYKTFAALYSLLPEGGEVEYDDLIKAVKSQFSKSKTEGKIYEDMCKFIQRNLTDKSNGFMRYANIPEKEDNGKPLIKANRGIGIAFNNKSG